MVHSAAKRNHWRNQAYVTQRKAAEIFGRTPEWVRDTIDDNDLATIRLRDGGHRMVCVQSICDLLERMQSSTPAGLSASSMMRGAAWPRLVWVNPNH